MKRFGSIDLSGYLLVSAFIISVTLSILIASVQPVSAQPPGLDSECDETCTLQWIETNCGDCAWIYPQNPDMRTYAYWCFDSCTGQYYWDYRDVCGKMCF